MKIVTTSHPSLRVTAQPITSWDKKLETQIKQMIRLLEASHDPKGVGLSSTQVECKNRIFLLTIDEEIQVFINPKILASSKKMLTNVYKNPKKRWLEGCLSIPTIWGFVDRPWQVEVEYQLPQNLKKIQAKLDDFNAAAFQHELDHLNGVLFTDHILKQKGQIYQQIGDDLEPISLL